MEGDVLHSVSGKADFQRVKWKGMVPYVYFLQGKDLQTAHRTRISYRMSTGKEFVSRAIHLLGFSTANLAFQRAELRDDNLRLVISLLLQHIVHQQRFAGLFSLAIAHWLGISRQREMTG